MSHIGENEGPPSPHVHRRVHRRVATPAAGPLSTHTSIKPSSTTNPTSNRTSTTNTTRRHHQHHTARHPSRHETHLPPRDPINLVSQEFEETDFEETISRTWRNARSHYAIEFKLVGPHGPLASTAMACIPMANMVLVYTWRSSTT